MKTVQLVTFPWCRTSLFYTRDYGVSVAVCTGVSVCVDVYSMAISSKLAKQVIPELATKSIYAFVI